MSCHVQDSQRLALPHCPEQCKCSYPEVESHARRPGSLTLLAGCTLCLQSRESNTHHIAEHPISMHEIYITINVGHPVNTAN